MCSSSTVQCYCSGGCLLSFAFPALVMHPSAVLVLELMATLVNLFILDSSCSKTLLPWTIYMPEDDRITVQGYYEMVHGGQTASWCPGSFERSYFKWSGSELVHVTQKLRFVCILSDHVLVLCGFYFLYRIHNENNNCQHAIASLARTGNYYLICSGLISMATFNLPSIWNLGLKFFGE